MICLWIVTIAILLHCGVAMIPDKFWRKRGQDGEQIRQHHEKCVMLGLIALCILEVAR